MPTDALLLALAAAVVHAAWNLLLARAPDARTGAAAQLIVSIVVWAPIALIVWRVQNAALPYLGASCVLELAYFSLLAAAYSEGELSLVYPLARGGAPLLVALAAAVGVGGSFGALQGLGIVAIALGVVAVRGVKGPWRGRDTLLAGATAVTIASYTVLDRYGVRHANPLTYVWLELAPVAVIYAAVMARRRGVAAIREAIGLPSIVAGIGGIGSYVLVLAALRLTSAAPVAAIRESSVVIAVGLASVVLGEKVSRARLAGAFVVAAGTALVAAG
ncbi:MAG: EamA family transporter [Solirubrobacteraceae bacterium]|nr:EamA family transporter [Solirubrobacteraceae bacterium]